MDIVKRQWFKKGIEKRAQWGPPSGDEMGAKSMVPKVLQPHPMSQDSGDGRGQPRIAYLGVCPSAEP